MQLTEKINSSRLTPTPRIQTKDEVADEDLGDMLQRIKETTDDKGKDDEGTDETSREKEAEASGAKIPELPAPVSEQEELASRLELLGLKDMSQFTK